MFGQTARRSFGRGCEARLVLSSSLRSDAVSLLLLLLLLLLSHKHSETADYQQTALQSELSTADLHREPRHRGNISVSASKNNMDLINTN